MSETKVGSMNDNKWLIIPNPKPMADLKLICFPYAGGSASTYLTWSEWLPANVELVAIQLPGRASRLFEKAHSDFDTLIEALLEFIPNLIDRPYVFFGHSLGSRIAFGLMSKMKDKGLKLPIHFIASGSRAPHISSKAREISHLPDEEFIVVLRQLNGTPKAVLENRDIMSIYLPLLRADFQLASACYIPSKYRFDCPISVLGGKGDKVVCHSDLLRWEELFSHPLDLNYLVGDHFFIESNKQLMAEAINRVLNIALKSLLIRLS